MGKDEKNAVVGKSKKFSGRRRPAVGGKSKKSSGRPKACRRRQKYFSQRSQRFRNAATGSASESDERERGLLNQTILEITCKSLRNLRVF